MGLNQEDFVLHYDNQSVVHLAKNLVFHSRMKHIKIRYHFITMLITEGMFNLMKILNAKNPKDILTKVVKMEKLKHCIDLTGLP